jgi:iron complex outermembrane receptor protein
MLGGDGRNNDREEAMRKSLVRSLFVASSTLVLSSLAGQALAQQAPPAQNNQGTTLQEVVVTAQRQAQSLLTVPMAITASTGQQLAKAGIREIADLQFTTPGLVPSYSSGYTQLYIRGVGNSIFVGADPSVATFIDDVPRIYGSMVQNFVDVERVEVLKGAQGGLYGRNATGGVVNIITRQPSTDAYHADARVLYGEKSTLQVAAYANMPINDKVAVSFAAERDSHDPYSPNLAQPNHYTAANFPQGSFLGTPAATAAFFNSGSQPAKGYNDQDFWAVDSKVLIKPTDNFKITIAGDWARKWDSSGNQIFNSTPGFATNFFLPAFFGNFHIPFTPTPGFIQGSTAPFTVEKGIPAFTHLQDYGGSMTAVYSLPGVDLTSITAYRQQQTNFYEELAPAPVPLQDVLVRNRKGYVYQEFRAVSTGAGPWHFLAGATYLSTHFKGLTDLTILPPFPPTADLILARSKDYVKNWSIYAQAGYDFGEHFNLTVSGRYVHEKNNAIFQLPTATTSSEESKFLPAATLSYKLDGGGNIYARYARGFKAGGVNPVANPFFFQGNPTGSIFGPEVVDTYEVGYRAPLFDRSVQVTTSVFYNDYTGLQTPAHATPEHPEIILAIVNAGSARTYGADGSITWRVNRPLTLGASAAYLDAKYKTFAFSSNVLEAFDLSGKTMLNSPKWQLSFTGDFDQPVTDQFRFVANAVVSHLSSVIYQPSAIPALFPDASGQGYWLMNLRVGARTTDDKYGVALFVNNLFNRGYVTYGSSSAATGGNVLTWGNPRIVGGEVTAKF